MERGGGIAGLSGQDFQAFPSPIFIWDKFMQTSWDGDGALNILGGQLKTGWLYDISWVPPPLHHAETRRQRSLFIVALQRIATCGINYAAIMSCFVAESLGSPRFL